MSRHRAVTRWNDAAAREVMESTVDAVAQKIDDGAFALKATNHLGQTLVFYAVQNSHCALEMTQLLVEKHRLSINHVDRDHQTALHYLAKTNNIECLQYLARRGANLNHKDHLHQTPIFFAASKGTPHMIQALFEHRAEVDVLDRTGKTPFGWAHTEENFHTLSMCYARSDPSLLLCSVSPSPVSTPSTSVGSPSSMPLPSSVSSTTASTHGGGIREADVSGGPPPLEDIEPLQPEAKEVKAVNMKCLEGHHGLHGSVNNDESCVFAVMVASEADVNRLADLEMEFIEDHQTILEDKMPDASCQDICEVVGLNPSRSERRAIIRRITSAKSPVQWTLKIVRLSGYSIGVRQASVVGYCYCYQKDPAVCFTVSHLKISRCSQRRGCASLLFAGALLRIHRLEKQGKIEPHFGAKSNGRLLKMSVVEENVPARALYQKLGFVTVVPAYGKPIAWIKMATRHLEETTSVLKRLLDGVGGTVQTILDWSPQESTLQTRAKANQKIISYRDDDFFNFGVNKSVVPSAPPPKPKGKAKPKYKAKAKAKSTAANAAMKRQQAALGASPMLHHPNLKSARFMQ